MKHRKKIVKLGRMSSHRNAMLSNMAGSIILYKKIQTTFQKAKAVKPLIEKLITWSKEGTLHARRIAFSILKDRTLVRQLFTEIAPVMANRSGGYTRIIRTGIRTGDGATMAILELVGHETIAVKEDKKDKKKEKKTEKKEEKPKEKDKHKAKDKAKDKE